MGQDMEGVNLLPTNIM